MIIAKIGKMSAHTAAIGAMLLISATTRCAPSARNTPSVHQRVASNGAGTQASNGADVRANGRGAPSAAAEPRESAAADTGGRPAPSPIAEVNGLPVDRRAFSEALLRAHGLDLLQRWILRDLARRAAAEAGLTVSAQDIEREYELMFRESAGADSAVVEWSAQRREQFVEEVVRLRGWSRAEMDLVMERQACLRKVCERRVTVDDDLLRQEFARRHGEKVEIRHIQVPALRFAESLKARLAAGESFEALAREHSENLVSRETGGLLPPFARAETGYPAAFVEVAFRLNPGEVSNPIQIEGAYHLLRLERRIPADTRTLDEVKDALRIEVRGQLLTQEMNNLSAYLFRTCRLAINEPTLRALYRERHQRGEIEGPPPAEP